MLWMITDFQRTPEISSACRSISLALRAGAEKVTIRNKGIFSLKEILKIFESVKLEHPEKEIFLHDIDRALVPGCKCFHFPSNKSKDAFSLKKKEQDLKAALSAHSVKECEQAFAMGMDYLFLSPIFKPLSKPEDKRKLVEPLYLKNLYLLGGIDRMRGRLLIEKGFTNIAGISLFYGNNAEKDIYELSSLIKEKENESFDPN